MDRKEQKKAYYLKNKERIKAYREANKERINEYQKEYMKEWSKTPANKKSSTISNWKKRGLINEDYDALYQKYIESTNCEECNCEFGKYRDGSYSFRCMDHSHITGLFRNFLCSRCNTRRGE